MSGRAHAVAANWLWLAGAIRPDAALVVSDDAAPWVSGLGNHFASVDVERATGATLARFPEGAFDCVLIPGFLGAWSGLSREVPEEEARLAILRECRRLLRAGGVLYASGPNPWWRGEVEHLMTTADYNDTPESRPVVAPPGAPRLAERLAWVRSDRIVAHALRDAGFRRQGTYFAEPSDLLPRAIIPARRAAALAFERQERALRGRAPRLLARAGLHAVIYPTILLLVFT